MVVACMLVGLSVVGTLLAGGWWTAERRESIEGLEKSRVQLFGHKRNDLGVKVFGQMVSVKAADVWC
jgi:hypothetical protein